MVNTETIDKLFLELGQFTQARTARELVLEKENQKLKSAVESFQRETVQIIQAKQREYEHLAAHRGFRNSYTAVAKALAEVALLVHSLPLEPER